MPMIKNTIKPNILVIGDIILDYYLIGESSRISPEAPIPVVQIEDHNFTLGGAGNVASNLASLGANVEIISVVGKDNNAKLVKDLLKKRSIKFSNIIHSKNRITSKKTRVVANKQQVVRFDEEVIEDIEKDVESLLVNKFKETIVSKKIDSVILSDYGKGVLTKNLTKNLIEIARKNKITVACDPKGSNFLKYKRSTLITPNKKEASLATNIIIKDKASLKKAGRKLLKECELDYLLITLSEEGMALFTDKKMHLFPTNIKTVYDVSGAGDTVIAAFTFAISHQLNILDACNFANAAAGIVVGKHGTSVITLDEIDAYQNLSMSSKEIAFKNLSKKIIEIKKAKKKIVFTNGCFDILHAGHVSYLQKASRLGDILIVGVNSDNSIKKIKGKNRPINNESDRIKVLSELNSISYVILFNDETPIDLIKQISPDVLVKGADYSLDDVVGKDYVIKNGGSVKLIDFVEGKSTSSLIKKITKQGGL